MTTIIWNYGRLCADSRVTNYMKLGGVELNRMYEDRAVKIIEPKNAMIGTNKVLAIAIAGDAGLLSFIPNLDAIVGDMGARFDIGQQDTFTEFFKQEREVFPCSIICVTAKRIYNIEMCRYTFELNENLPLSTIVAGSAPEETKYELLRLPPFLAMVKAMQVDPCTGGHVTVWRYGKTGIVTYNLGDIARITARQFKVGKMLNGLRTFCAAISVMTTYRKHYRNNPLFN